MSKTVAVSVELLEELIEQHITAKGFTNETARKAQAILSAPVVDEPAKYPIEGHVYTNKNFGPMKYLGIENCPDGSFMMFRSTEMRKEKYYTAAELPQWFAEFSISSPNTGSAGQSISRCSQSHSEAGWCGTDDCYRRNR